MKTRKQAADAAARCKARMERGAVWKTRIFENLGWHWELRCGNLILSPSAGGGYYCLLSRSGSGGETFWTDHCTHRSPNAAVSDQIMRCDTFIDECRQLMSEVKHKLWP